MGVSVFPAAGGGVTQKVQEFTSTNTFVTPSNVSSIEVFLVAGGGGGGGVSGNATLGGGGGGGSVMRKFISVTPGTTYTVTIGAGGSGGSAGASGSNGSDTTFGLLATAYGGGFGGGASDTAPVYGGVRGTIGGTGGASAAGSHGGGALAVWTPTGGTTVPYGANGLNSGIQASPQTLYSGGWSSTGDAASPGFGIEGFGGGGWRGPSGASNRPHYISIHGGGVGAYNTTGGAGTVNLGGGGGGSYKNSIDRAGGNGGSGYARIVYWS